MTKNHRLGVAQGTAMLLGGVLGPGILVLPHLAAVSAGPASTLAWLGLLALSVPVALTFAALGSRYPDGGGVAAFAGRAFGPRVKTVVGWWFFGVLPIGGVAAAMMGGEYVSASLGLDRTTAACLILVFAFATNAAGLRASSRIQLGLATVLVVLLVSAMATASGEVRAENFTPFAPHGLTGVAAAAGVLMWAFVGWEAASHLSADFRDAKSLTRATILTLVVVGALYVTLAVVAVGTGASNSTVPLTELLETGIGSAARPITGIAALALTFGAVNLYLAAGARLGASLAAERSLPSWFASPERSLGLLAVLTAVTAVPIFIWSVDMDALVRITSACLAAVTLVGVAAAIRLLDRKATAWIATVFSSIALACCGPYLLAPAAMTLLALRTAGTGQPENVSEIHVPARLSG